MNRYGLTLIIGILLAAPLLTGCAADSSEPTATTEPTTPAAATDETTAENTLAAEPTAIAQAPTIQQTVLVDGLEHPWGLDWLPDGTMIVTERPGRVRLIRAGQLAPTPIAGVPEVLTTGQGGLLDVSVHPQFADNQWIYFTYAQGDRSANQKMPSLTGKSFLK